MANPLIEELRRVLDYDPETGIFRWKVDRLCIRAGAVAGGYDRHRYMQIMYKGKNYKAHRLAWMLTYGEEPSGGIDHADGNPCNNALSNLRVCCQSKNAANMKLRRDSSTGFKGVSYRKDTGRYAAYLTVNYKRKCLGCYDTAEQAHSAYVEAAKSHFGEFARP